MPDIEHSGGREEKSKKKKDKKDKKKSKSKSKDVESKKIKSLESLNTNKDSIKPVSVHTPTIEPLDNPGEEAALGG